MDYFKKPRAFFPLYVAIQVLYCSRSATSFKIGNCGANVISGVTIANNSLTVRDRRKCQRSTIRKSGRRPTENVFSLRGVCVPVKSIFRQNSKTERDRRKASIECLSRTQDGLSVDRAGLDQCRLCRSYGVTRYSVSMSIADNLKTEVWRLIHDVLSDLRLHCCFA